MLLRGSLLNDESGDSVCYLALFRKSDVGGADLILGNNFLEHYYTVFDAEEDQLQVYLGEKSKALTLDKDAANGAVQKNSKQMILITVLSALALFFTIISVCIYFKIKKRDEKKTTAEKR